MSENFFTEGDIVYWFDSEDSLLMKGVVVSQALGNMLRYVVTEWKTGREVTVAGRTLHCSLIGALEQGLEELLDIESVNLESLINGKVT